MPSRKQLLLLGQYSLPQTEVGLSRIVFLRKSACFSRFPFFDEEEIQYLLQRELYDYVIYDKDELNTLARDEEVTGGTEKVKDFMLKALKAVYVK